MQISEIVKQRIEENFDEIVAIRRDLHMHPELSEQEERTMNKISEYLTAWGIPHTTKVGGHGVVGVIEGKLPREEGRLYEAVGIRGDIDALPIQEAVECPFKSVNEGVMHACGHDIHTAMVLGTAKVLKSLEDSFSGTVKLFFQPAEETTGGADQMIKDGCMENPKVGAVLAFHVTPNLPTGTIEFKRGKMNAATCELYIEVEGVACHGAHPETGIDAVVVGAQIITALQSIISRNLSPTNAGIVTVGQFHAGVKDNVVAGSAVMTGTLRALDPETMQTLKSRVTATAEGICQAYGAKARVRLTDGYPALINGDSIYDEMESLALEELGRGKIAYMPEASLGADDFAFFTSICDGLYMNVGVNSGKETHPQNIHNEWFNPDEEAMKNGIFMEAMGALKLLSK